MLFYLSLTSFLILKFTKQTYGVNDDVIIQSWLSGSYTGNSEFMIRGSATPKMLFGLIVSNLYKLTNSINWYSLIILGATLLSWYFIGLVVMNFKNLISIFGYLIISSLHLLWFIPSPTYTASAILLTLTSLIFLISRINSGITSISIIAITFVFAYLIRPESFYFAVTVCSPIFLYFVFKNIKIYLKKIALFILLALSIILIDHIFQIYYYQTNKNWAEYASLESLRYQIQANNPEKLLLENPLKYGWSIEEAKLFENYLTIDKAIFNEDKYKQVLKTTPKSEINNYYKFLYNGHKNLINSDINWEWFNLASLIPLSFLLFLFALWPRVKIFLILTLSSYAIGYLIMIYVATFLRQPERVQVSAIFLAILIPIVVTSSLSSEPLKTSTKKLPTLILMMLITTIVLSKSIPQATYLNNKYSGATNVFWVRQVEFLSKFPEDSIFIGNASMFRNNWISPYKVKVYEVENRIFTLGWHNFSPHWISRAEKLGLNPDNLLKNVVTDKNVYWLSDPTTIQYVSEYMIENRFSNSKPQLVDKIDFVGDEYGVWKFSK